MDACVCKHEKGDSELGDQWAWYFGTAPWFRHRGWLPAFFVFRVSLFLTMFVVFVNSFTFDLSIGCGKTFFLYWTHIMLLIQNVYLFTAALACWKARLYVTGRARVVESRTSLTDGPRVVEVTTIAHTPWYVRCAWVLQDFQLIGTLVVTVGYWGFVEEPWKLAWLAHGLNLCVAVLDFLICRQWILSIHAIWVGLGMLTYTVLTIVFYLVHAKNCNGDEWIYKAMDYSNPWVWFALVPALACILCVYRVLVCVSDRFRRMPCGSSDRVNGVL